MSWITVDTGLPNHPKMAALPNDTARWGWLVTLCEAKEQRKPGVFASERHYRHVMVRHRRFLSDYLKAGLLEKDEDGALVVHDWKRHQWAVSKAQQRETFEGHGEDRNGTSVGQKEDASRAVSVRVPVDVVSTEGVQGEPDAAVAFRDRTGEFPAGKILGWITELGKAHGERRLAEMIARTPQSGTVVDYLRTVRDNLRAEDHAAERAEAADEKRRLEEKRRPIPMRSVEEPEISAEEADRIAREYIAEFGGKSA